MEHNPQRLLILSRWAKIIAWLILILGILGTAINSYRYYRFFGENSQSILTNSNIQLSLLDGIMGSFALVLLMLVAFVILLTASQLIPYLQKLLIQIESRRKK